MKTYTASQEDGGLWIIRDRHNKTIGAVFNRGYDKEDRIRDEWLALDGWCGCEPGSCYGIAKTFSGAVSLVFQASRYSPSEAQIAFEKMQAELSKRADDFFFLLPSHGAVLSRND